MVYYYYYYYYYGTHTICKFAFTYVIKDKENTSSRHLQLLCGYNATLLQIPQFTSLHPLTYTSAVTIKYWKDSQYFTLSAQRLQLGHKTC